MNFKKGANAFVLSIVMFLVGIFVKGVYFFVLFFWEKETGPFALSFFLGEMGDVALLMGGVWLTFSLAGSLFTFNTEKWIMRAFVAGVLSGFIVFVFLFIIIVTHTNIFNHPWIIIAFEVLVGLMFLLISSTFFFHAARPVDSKPDRMERLLAELIHSRKVLLFRQKCR